MWIFGYGSLIWRPDMAYDERHPAYLRGWQRAFAQASPDHRGTPEAPGRVVTLHQQPDKGCWGMVYRIPLEEREPILESLDFREKAGYEHHWLSLTLADTEGNLLDQTVKALVYVASPTNENYIGVGSFDEMARHIISSHGPSGANVEYALELAKSLRQMKVQDEHVFQLEAQILAQLNKDPSSA